MLTQQIILLSKSKKAVSSIMFLLSNKVFLITLLTLKTYSFKHQSKKSSEKKLDHKRVIFLAK